MISTPNILKGSDILFEIEDNDDPFEVEKYKQFLETFDDFPYYFVGRATFIHENHFEVFLKERLQAHHVNWNQYPFNHIDWDAAAEQFQDENCTSSDLTNVTYWVIGK
jgi:hypothetical protein